MLLVPATIPPLLRTFLIAESTVKGRNLAIGGTGDNEPSYDENTRLITEELGHSFHVVWSPRLQADFNSWIHTIELIEIVNHRIRFFLILR